MGGEKAGVGIGVFALKTFMFGGGERQVKVKSG
jgi:hypothetical protein